MVKLAIAGVMITLICVQLKNSKPEYAVILSIAGIVLLFSFSMEKIRDILMAVNRIEGMLSIDFEYIEILLKIVGITYLSEFASDLCRDSGHAAIGNQIEFGAKLSILALSIPIIMSLMNIISQL